MINIYGLKVFQHSETSSGGKSQLLPGRSLAGSGRQPLFLLQIMINIYELKAFKHS
jgi:hypothetical protein